MAPLTRSATRLQHEAAQREAENEAELKKTSDTYNMRKRKPTEVPDKAAAPIRSSKKSKVSHQKTEKRKRGGEDEDKPQEKEEPVRVVKRMKDAAKPRVVKDKRVQEVPEVSLALSTAVSRRTGTNWISATSSELEELNALIIPAAGDFKIFDIRSNGILGTVTARSKGWTGKLTKSVSGSMGADNRIRTFVEIVKEVFARNVFQETAGVGRNEQEQEENITRGSSSATSAQLPKTIPTSKTSDPLKRSDDDSTDTDTIHTADNDNPTIFSPAVRDELLPQQGRPTLSKKAQGKKPAEKEYFEESFTDYGNGTTIHFETSEKRKILTPEEMANRTEAEKHDDKVKGDFYNLAASWHQELEDKAMRDWEKKKSSSKARAPTRASTSK